MSSVGQFLLALWPSWSSSTWYTRTLSCNSTVPHDHSENGSWIYLQIFIGSAIQEKEWVEVKLLPWSWSIQWVQRWCQTTPQVPKKWPKLFTSILLKLKSTLIALAILGSLSSADPTLVKRRSCSAFATPRSAPTFIIPRMKGCGTSSYSATDHWCHGLHSLIPKSCMGH